MGEQQLRVLVIEDNPGDARLLREALLEASAETLEVVWADRLDRGLGCLQDDSIDALLLDLGLPDSQGMATFERVQEEAPHLPIVVLSGLDDEHLAMEAVQRGAQDYLVKGQVNAGLLGRAVRYAVERKRAEQHILHLNSVLRAIRDVNQLCNRERDRGRLLRGIAEALGTASGYQSAWIAIFGPHKNEVLVSHSGGPEGADEPGTPTAPGCLSDCMAAAAATTVHDQTQCGQCEFCALSANTAAVVVRLTYAGRVFGALAVIMPRHLTSDPDELALVDEVANDAAYALHGLDNEEKRREAETALRQSERKFRAIFEHASDPIIIYDLAGEVLEVNHVACERFGYGHHELLLMNVAQLYMPETRREFEAGIVRLRQRGQDATEADFRRRGGLWLPVELSSSLIRYNGRAAVLTSVRDITSRKRAEEAQRMAAVGQLAAGVAHEFNNVLAGMSARAQVARSARNQEAWEQVVECVMRLTTRGSDIAKDLISFARPGQPQKAPIALEDQVEAALAVAGREIENGQVRVERDYQARPRLVLADAGQVQQVLLNVILNACHAMPDGGLLAIATRFEPAPGEPDEIVLEIADNGVGITPESLPHVFEPFFTTKGAYGESQRPGAGLGLSVSQALVRANGGTIVLESVVGCGTTCAIRLPAVEGELPAAPEEAGERHEAPVPRQGEGLVLLAEDEEDIRVPIAMALRQCGFEVVEAATLPQALQVVSRKRLKAVVSDLMMPGGDGRRILELTEHMLCPPAVVFMTGKSEDNLVQKLMDGGAKLVLSKPVDVDEIVKAVLRLTMPVSPNALS